MRRFRTRVRFPAPPPFSPGCGTIFSILRLALAPRLPDDALVAMRMAISDGLRAARQRVNARDERLRWLHPSAKRSRNGLLRRVAAWLRPGGQHAPPPPAPNPLRATAALPPSARTPSACAPRRTPRPRSRRTRSTSSRRAGCAGSRTPPATTSRGSPSARGERVTRVRPARRDGGRRSPGQPVRLLHRRALREDAVRLPGRADGAISRLTSTPATPRTRAARSSRRSSRRSPRRGRRSTAWWRSTTPSTGASGTSSAKRAACGRRSETLAEGRGSCRDSAVLLVAALRSRGLAARFVSGYLVQLTDEGMIPDEPRGVARDVVDLHAWAEVYLPGGGWIGLDATSGLLCGEGHIPLACTARARPPRRRRTGRATCRRRGRHLRDEGGPARATSRGRRLRSPRRRGRSSSRPAIASTRRSRRQGVELTVGGEPTFTSRLHPEAPEWNGEALGADKWEQGVALAEALRTRIAPGRRHPAPLRQALPRREPAALGARHPRRDATASPLVTDRSAHRARGPLVGRRRAAPDGRARRAARRRQGPRARGVRRPVAPAARRGAPARRGRSASRRPSRPGRAAAARAPARSRSRHRGRLRRSRSRAPRAAGWRGHAWTFRRERLYLVPGRQPDRAAPAARLDRGRAPAAARGRALRRARPIRAAAISRRSTSKQAAIVAIEQPQQHPATAASARHCASSRATGRSSSSCRRSRARRASAISCKPSTRRPPRSTSASSSRATRRRNRPSSCTSRSRPTLASSR